MKAGAKYSLTSHVIVMRLSLIHVSVSVNGPSAPYLLVQCSSASGQSGKSCIPCVVGHSLAIFVVIDCLSVSVSVVDSLSLYFSSGMASFLLG